MNWIELKERMPEKRKDRLGHRSVIVLGAVNPVIGSYSYAMAYIDENNKIINSLECKAADLTYWTHWMDIPDVPGGK